MRKVSLFQLAAAPLAAGVLAAMVSAASAQSVVRIGMTAADIPKTVGQPDQGFEGNRFTGNTMYEGLTTWDLSSADKASVRDPGRRDRMGRIAGRPDQMDLQAALRREIP